MEAKAVELHFDLHSGDIDEFSFWLLDHGVDGLREATQLSPNLYRVRIVLSSAASEFGLVMSCPWLLTPAVE